MTNPILKPIQNAIEIMRELSTDDVRRMTMERADSVLSGYGYTRGPSVGSQVMTHLASFGVGMAVGAGVGMLLSPKAGAELRSELGDAMKEMFESTTETVKDATASATETVKGATASAAETMKSATSSANGAQQASAN